MAKLPTFRAQRSTPIRGFSMPASAAANQVDVRTVVSRVNYSHLDPAGREMRIASQQTVRLDRQPNPTGGGANLQIQLNDQANAKLPKGAGTTIAQVLIPKSVYDIANTCHERNVHEHLASTVRSALLESAKSLGSAYTIAEG